MTRETKKYTVMLFGEPYTLVSDEPESTILLAVSRVNALMNELSSALKTKEAKRIAVLTALQLANQQLSFESNLNAYQDELISKIDQLLVP